MTVKIKRISNQQVDLAADVPQRNEAARKSRVAGHRKTEFRLSQDEFDRFAAAARQRYGDKKGAMLELFVDMLELLKTQQP